MSIKVLETLAYGNASERSELITKAKQDRISRFIADLREPGGMHLGLPEELAFEDAPQDVIVTELERQKEQLQSKPAQSPETHTIAIVAKAAEHAVAAATAERSAIDQESQAS